MVLHINNELASGSLLVTGEPAKREDEPIDGHITIEPCEANMVRVTVRDAYFPDDWAVSFTISREVLMMHIRSKR